MLKLFGMMDWELGMEGMIDLSGGIGVVDGEGVDCFILV